MVKTIKIEDVTHNKLVVLKAKYKFKSIDDTILYLYEEWKEL